jgi:hypothetical protein
MNATARQQKVALAQLAIERAAIEIIEQERLSFEEAAVALARAIERLARHSSEQSG